MGGVSDTVVACLINGDRDEAMCSNDNDEILASSTDSVIRRVSPLSDRPWNNVS